MHPSPSLLAQVRAGADKQARARDRTQSGVARRRAILFHEQRFAGKLEDQKGAAAYGHHGTGGAPMCWNGNCCGAASANSANTNRHLCIGANNHCFNPASPRPGAPAGCSPQVISAPPDTRMTTDATVDTPDASPG